MRKLKEQQTKVKLVIAGPGSGKTTGLVQEVLSKLPALKSNRFMVVITYTNAATDKIREKLQKETTIPNNLFIGTIHSFLNRFILSPYAYIFGIIPGYIKFIDEITGANDKQKKYIILKHLRDKGIITYEEIETISKTLICGGKLKVQRGEVIINQGIARKITEYLCKRIQAIFIDEYQDANTSEHAIFKRIIESGKTDYFYCVGDPEQYIYSFTYRNKRGKPNFSKIPIKDIEDKVKVTKEEIQTNFRATKNLVSFLNNFSPVNQISQCEEEGDKIYFIKETSIDNILRIFRAKYSQYNPGLDVKYHLSYSLKNNINYFNNIKIIDCNAYSTTRILSESLRYVAGIIDKSLRSIRETRGLPEIELRKIGMKVLKMIKNSPNVSPNEINTMITEELNSSLIHDVDSSSSLEKLKTVFFRHIGGIKDYCATIHKSKGLEADAVLAVAETKNRLHKWFETDPSKRIADLNDECRLGYVAFSRAKKLLCIACLQDIEDFEEKLVKLQVEIIGKTIQNQTL